MEKFCANCGAELKEGQEVCLGCGRVLAVKEEKKKNHNVYITISSIVMIVIGVALLMNFQLSIFVYGIPGILGLVAGVIGLCSKKNKDLLFVSGIFHLVGAGINTIAIMNISIYGILSIVFGIMNVVYGKEKSSI